MTEYIVRLCPNCENIRNISFAFNGNQAKCSKCKWKGPKKEMIEEKI